MRPSSYPIPVKRGIKKICKVMIRRRTQIQKLSRQSKFKILIKIYLIFQIIFLIAIPNQRDSMAIQLMKKVGQKKAANPSSAIRVIF